MWIDQGTFKKTNTEYENIASVITTSIWYKPYSHTHAFIYSRKHITFLAVEEK